MKLLIAYDGSKDAESAIDDLRRCGLPAAGVARVISVAEVWLPPEAGTDDEAGSGSAYIDEIVHDHVEKAEKEVAEAKLLAKFAEGRVRAALPGWDVSSFASYGSPGWEIVTEAEKIDADLILVGAQGQSFLSRFILGSISQKVLTEAHCSVRVGRGRIDVDPGPERIVVAFDGSRGAKAAVDAVASRSWSDGTEVRLIAITEPTIPTAIARFVTPMKRTVNVVDTIDHPTIERSAEAQLARLKDNGLDATFRICAGNPKSLLSVEADTWGADCIFLGANAWGSRLERFLIGSTSAAVAARAHCSVEVVRAKVAASQEIDYPRQDGLRPTQPGILKSE